MHILQIHNFYQQPGGEDEVFKAETSLLEAYNHQVVRYTIHNDALATMNGIEAATATVWNRRTYSELQSLINREKPQIAHFHNTFPLISPAAYYAVKSQGIPIIQTLHNYRLLCLNAEFFREGKVCEDCLGKRVPLPGIVHACYRHDRIASAAVAAMLSTHRILQTWNNVIDYYIALTDFARQKLIEGGIPSEKIVVKPNFVHPDPNVGTGKGNYALFVGRLSHEKGIGTLLEAWRKLGTTITLKIVGDGPLASQVAETIHELQGVEWLGRKSLNEVYTLMGEAAFLIFPSEWYETFGRVATEAFAKGTPVVASKIGAIEELVDNGCTGLFFHPSDSEDLATKVQWLLSHPDQLSQMRQKARLEFERKYTAQENYQRLMKIYEVAIARSR